MLKIFRNIIKNPSQIAKYGDLHAHRINDKLNKCKPALNLLYIAGFKKTNNNTRLIWTNTNNNIETLKYIHQTLQSIMNMETIASDSDKKKERMTMAKSETFDELINLGFTKEEASAAISISNNIDLTQCIEVANQVSKHEKIQTENKESVGAADCKDVDILTTNSAANNSTQTKWQCEICTLINDNLSSYCQACSNPRDGDNTYQDIQELVLSLMKQTASQVAFFTSVNVYLCCIV